MNDEVKAPWTDDQVRTLNKSQKLGHPFTCGIHTRYSLVAANDGWSCSFPEGCSYKQYWAFAMQADEEFVQSHLDQIRMWFGEDV